MEAARSELIRLASRRLATECFADEGVDVLAGQRPKIGNGQAPGTVTGRGAAGADAGLVAVNSVVAVAGFAAGIPTSGPFVAAPSIGPGAVFFGADGERVDAGFTVEDGLDAGLFVAVPAVPFFDTTCLAAAGVAPPFFATAFFARDFFAVAVFAIVFFVATFVTAGLPAVPFLAVAFDPAVLATGFAAFADDRVTGVFAAFLTAFFPPFFATVFAVFVAVFLAAGFAAGFAGRRDVVVDRGPVDARLPVRADD